MVKPPLQQLGHDRHVRGGPAAGEEDPVQRRVQAGRRLQALDAVVGQRPAQLDPERFRQALRVGVPGAQVSVHVLLRVPGGLGVDRGLVVGLRLAGHPAAPPQRRHVGEDLQDPGLAGQQPGVVGGQFGPRRGQPLQLPPGLGLVDVEAEHQAPQRNQRVRGHGGRILLVRWFPAQRAQISANP